MYSFNLENGGFAIFFPKFKNNVIVRKNEVAFDAGYPPDPALRLDSRFSSAFLNASLLNSMRFVWAILKEK